MHFIAATHGITFTLGAYTSQLDVVLYTIFALTRVSRNV